MKATLIRLGLGQTPSGQVLDRDTRWFMLSEDCKNPMTVYNEAVKSGKPIFYKGRNGYVEIGLDELKNICDRYILDQTNK